MEANTAVYNEVDLREMSYQSSPVCALDGSVYDISLLMETEPALQELVGCNLDELSTLIDDADPKVQFVREQITQLNLKPIGSFVSLREWEQQGGSTDLSKVKCPFASQRSEAAKCPFARERQPSHPPMTLKQLNVHDGSTPGLPRLMSFGGLVFNVTADERSFGPGGMFEDAVGQDCTNLILSRIPGASVPQVLGLFQAQYPVVGRLIAEPEPTAAREQAIKLHQYIDDNNVDAIGRMLEGCEESTDGTSCLAALANAVCPRTRLSALHKAVEANRPEIVKILLIHGAKLDTPAQLYDGDTPVQLAKRLGRTELAGLLGSHGSSDASVNTSA